MAPANQPPGELVVVESCTTTWAFDQSRKRFCRLPRGLELSATSAEWRPYHDMVLDRDGGTLEVSLDEAGTNLLKSHIHNGPCPDCGAA